MGFGKGESLRYKILLQLMVEQEYVSREVKTLRQGVGEKAGRDAQLGRAGVGEDTCGSVQLLSLILEITHTRSFQASLGTYPRQCGEGPWASISFSGSLLSLCTSRGWRGEVPGPSSSAAGKLCRVPEQETADPSDPLPSFPGRQCELMPYLCPYRPGLPAP